MDIGEIAVRELVPSLGAGVLLIVDAEMPLAELVVAMQPDELVFVSRGRLMLTPRIALVSNEMPLMDQVLGMVKGRLVQSHGHGFASLCWHQCNHPSWVGPH